MFHIVLNQDYQQFVYLFIYLFIYYVVSVRAWCNDKRLIWLHYHLLLVLLIESNPCRNLQLSVTDS